MALRYLITQHSRQTDETERPWSPCFQLLFANKSSLNLISTNIRRPKWFWQCCEVRRPRWRSESSLGKTVPSLNTRMLSPRRLYGRAVCVQDLPHHKLISSICPTYCAGGFRSYRRGATSATDAYSQACPFGWCRNQTSISPPPPPSATQPCHNKFGWLARLIAHMGHGAPFLCSLSCASVNVLFH